ncbi:MAG: TusE/DsrC/DsvC family sulfur relay protein [Gammaproteobacteria bacterium]|nr:TusE/DsrC/DsvC family sulfur relay protein [Gammaproteobacteria bacterium]
MVGMYSIEEHQVVHRGVVPLELDEEGFLANSDSWTEETARAIANLRGVGPLSSNHWAVIHYVRSKYLRLGSAPSIRSICRGSELSRSEVKALFGSCLDVWRISGLPDPGEEARSYMS